MLYLWTCLCDSVGEWGSRGLIWSHHSSTRCFNGGPFMLARQNATDLSFYGLRGVRLRASPSGTAGTASALADSARPHARAHTQACMTLTDIDRRSFGLCWMLKPADPHWFLSFSHSFAHMHAYLYLCATIKSLINTKHRRPLIDLLVGKSWVHITVTKMWGLIIYLSSLITIWF